MIGEPGQGGAGPEGPGPSGPGPSGAMQPADSPPGASAAGAPTRGDRVLLGLFVAYAVLLLVAAWAQLGENRALLDFFDVRRFFTR